MLSDSDPMLYTAADVRALDRLAIDTLPIAGHDLMQRAGQALFDGIECCWRDAAKLAVVCGAGNNAGDGYVVAKLLAEKGRQVEVLWLCAPEKLAGDAGRAARDFLAAGGRAVPFEPACLAGADLVVDALLGTGLTRAVEGDWRAAIEAINAASVPVLSVDIPSGLDADTGAVRGVAVRAVRTLTFIGRKRGLYTGAGPAYAGNVDFHALAVPESIYEKVPARARLLQAERLPFPRSRRRRDSHKGDFGHVLIIGGDRGMAGAARLAAEAAARVGAGLVSVATREDNVARIGAARAELMVHGAESMPSLAALIARATLIVVGPGLGRGLWGRQGLAAALDSRLPLVVDADALNLLAAEPVTRGHWVLTPHPGEAARLLGSDSRAVQADRFGAVEALAERHQAVVVLKGAGTLIAAPGAPIELCPYGNPGMASGGMGDVLSGVIGGLLAQGLDAADAARTGVCVHALAADRAARAGERGLLAGDVIAELRGVVNGLG